MRMHLNLRSFYYLHAEALQSYLLAVEAEKELRTGEAAILYQNYKAIARDAADIAMRKMEN